MNYEFLLIGFSEIVEAPFVLSVIQIHSINVGVIALNAINLLFLHQNK